MDVYRRDSRASTASRNLARMSWITAFLIFKEALLTITREDMLAINSLASSPLALSVFPVSTISTMESAIQAMVPTPAHHST